MRKIKFLLLNAIFKFLSKAPAYKKFFDKKVEDKAELITIELKKDFEARMKFLVQNDYRNGITKRDEHSCPIFEISIFEPDFKSVRMNDFFDGECSTTITQKHLKLDPYVWSFSSAKIRLGDIKNRAAHELAKKLIDDGFISYEVFEDPNTPYPNLLFSINVFK